MTPKPRGKTVIYEDTPTRIDVAEVVDPEVRWWVLVSVNTRERSRFPSVLLQSSAEAVFGPAPDAHRVQIVGPQPLWATGLAVPAALYVVTA
jgi:hypothetical protein